MRRSLDLLTDDGQSVSYYNLPDARKVELQEQYARNWIWRAVAALIEIKGFEPTLEWMSERLNVTKAEVAEAVEGLEALGIIRKTDSGFERVLKYVYYSEHDLERQNMIESHVLISHQLMNRLDPFNEQAGSNYKTGFLASNKTATEEFYDKLGKLLKEYLRKSSLEKPDDVVAFSFSSVSLTDSNKGESK